MTNDQRQMTNDKRQMTSDLGFAENKLLVTKLQVHKLFFGKQLLF